MKFRISGLIPLLLGLCLAVSCSGGSKDECPQASCPEDLVGHTLGCIAGSLSDIQFDSFAPGAIKQLYNNEADLIAALDNGKVDFIVTDSVMIFGIDRNIHPIEPAYHEKRVGGDVGATFRLDDAATCSRFNDFLAMIMADGTYSEMVSRWLVNDYGASVMPELETYSEGEPLRVATMVFAPFCHMKNSEWVGMEVELMTRFAAYLHRPVEFKMYEFASLIAAVKAGTADVSVAYIYINEERSKQVLFSDPYFHGVVTVFQRTANTRSKTPFYERIRDSFNNNLLVEDRWKLVVDGLWETIVISLLSLLIGTMMGAAVCYLRMSRHKLLSGFAKVYVDILRGVPMLVLLMIMFYVVLAQAGVSGRWVAIISFSINFSAYVCEIFRTGIAAVDKGQTEAGLAMGFTPVRTFMNFVVPQAVKNIMPVFTNESVSLVKATSIVGYVAIQDLTRMGDIIRSRTFDAFFPLIIVAILYFILAWLLGKALEVINRKLA